MSEKEQEWKPPVDGTPCWIEIPSINLEASKKFYSSVFPNWSFSPDIKGDEPHRVITMRFADESCINTLSGGIVEFSPECKSSEQTNGIGDTVYYFVDDIDETAKRIQAAGGRSAGEKTPEGKKAFYQYFKDVDGNRFGLYEMKK
ncbi:hypothetical protein F5884DRAFT_8130 [Xylogone sp. PMI_703]|nr:hypothetical protein F5884DRAFT_8130 [Xylogone sp. PMI_703]